MRNESLLPTGWASWPNEGPISADRSSIGSTRRGTNL